jgi:hypothetical protein
LRFTPNISKLIARKQILLLHDKSCAKAKAKAWGREWAAACFEISEVTSRICGVSLSFRIDYPKPMGLNLEHGSE